MAYIGNQPTTTAFLTDTFSANGSGTVFTLSAAPANTNSIIVAVSGVLQDPSTYSVSGTALTFSAAPPAGTGNISVRFLGIPASGIVNTAYRTQTEFTATAGQTTFSVPSYTVGFIDVYRNGALLGSADFTATNGTTVVLAAGASAGDLVETVSFYVSSVLNAIPAQNNAVIDNYILSMAGSKLTGTQSIPKAALPTGSVLQVVNATYSIPVSTTSTSFVTTNLTASITPTSSSSKILILVSLPMYVANAIYSGTMTVFRGTVSGTNLGDATWGFSNIFNGAASSQSCNYLDSPATTSSTTYTVAIKTENAAALVYSSPNGQKSTITLMEIAA